MNIEEDTLEQIVSLKAKLAAVRRERDEAKTEQNPNIEGSLAFKLSELSEQYSDTLKVLNGSKSELLISKQEYEGEIQRVQESGILLCDKLDELNRELITLRTELATLRDGWISVTERLPEDDEFYLCYHISGFQLIAEYRVHPLSAEGRFEGDDQKVYQLAEITHYRDLPAPPTDGRAE